MKKLRLNRKTVWPVVLAVGLVTSIGVIRSAGRKASRVAPDARTANRMATLPHIILWAWERPERLDFIDTNKAGVAFLAKTLYLRGEKVVTRPRLQPLNVRQGTALIAVARIEPSRSDPASLSNNQMEDASREIVELAQLPNVVVVQIDFDAKTSERAFYSDLLRRLRQALPPTTALSITALASWCKGDNWLDNLPVDEAVPMLFRMGADRSQIVSGLASGQSFSSPLCRQSSGVSTDETLAYTPVTERVYVFNPNSWSSNSFEKVLERYQR
jgi:hypothetical protein